MSLLSSVHLIPAVSAPVPPAWHLIASDEFSGTAVDTSLWWLYSGPGNQGIGVREPSAVTESDGELRITGSGNVGGGVQMKVPFLYGKVEVRARDDKGVGYGPAILLWPADNGWPKDGEVDLSEIPDGGRTWSLFNVHYGQGDQQLSKGATGDFSKWHTWTLVWTPTSLTEWIDGRLVVTVTKQAAIPHAPMRIAIQNDVGAPGHWIGGRDVTTPARVALHVDYVRIWQQG